MTRFNSRNISSYSRHGRDLLIRDRILIVCEGEETEPNYFTKFPKKPKIEVIGTGYNTLSLVQYAIRKRDSYEKKGIHYNQTWCVFDRDSFPADDFNNAFFLADKHKIKIAYSNPAFELWFYLHFFYHTAAIHRSHYCQRLSQPECLNCSYDKTDKDLYEKLLGKQKRAIINAEKLLKEYTDDKPERNDPSTTVHLLVKALNDLA